MYFYIFIYTCLTINEFITSSWIRVHLYNSSLGMSGDSISVSLDEFKQLIGDDIKSFLTDADCKRFLRARKLNVEKAAEMCISWWKWYNTYPSVPGKVSVCPRNIINPVEDMNESIYIRLMPHSNYGVGKDGHPIYWEQTGIISSRMGEVNKLLDLDDLVTRHIRQQEIAVARMALYSEKLSKPIESQIIVMNLMNLSYKLDTKALAAFKQTLVIDQNYYPERLHILFMINAPWFFTAMWAMIKPWVDPVTAEKIHIVGSNYISVLREYIDDKYIPLEYGGSCEDFPWQWPKNNSDLLESMNYVPPENTAIDISTLDTCTSELTINIPESPSLRTPLPTIHSLSLEFLNFKMNKVEVDFFVYHVKSHLIAAYVYK